MNMPFTRQSPSAHYRELVAIYRDMHINGEQSKGVSAAQMFPGHSLPRHAGSLKKLITHFGATTVLDYGSGKGMQYAVSPGAIKLGTQQFDSIPAYWGVDVTCYDPAYPPHATLPGKKFDATISTDVLEHCPEEDVPWIVDEMFSYATRFLYANVACYPAMKVMPNGENAHCTIRPYDWWVAVFRKTSERHGNLPWMLLVEELETVGGKSEPVIRPAGTIKMRLG